MYKNLWKLTLTHAILIIQMTAMGNVFKPSDRFPDCAISWAYHPLRNKAILDRLKFATPDGAEADVRTCMSKAIAIVDAIDIHSTYHKGQALQLIEGSSNDRLNTAVYRIGQATNHFSLNSLFSGCSLNFDECLFSDVEWEFKAQSNRRYMVTYHFCVEGDFDPEGTIIMNFDLNSGGFSATVATSQLDARDDGDYTKYTELKLQNNIVTYFNRENFLNH